MFFLFRRTCGKKLNNFLVFLSPVSKGQSKMHAIQSVVILSIFALTASYRVQVPISRARPQKPTLSPALQAKTNANYIELIKMCDYTNLVFKDECPAVQHYTQFHEKLTNKGDLFVLHQDRCISREMTPFQWFCSMTATAIIGFMIFT